MEMKLLCAVNKTPEQIEFDKQFDKFYIDYCDKKNLIPKEVESEYFDLIYDFFSSYYKDREIFSMLTWEQYFQLLPFRSKFKKTVMTDYGVGYLYEFNDSFMRHIRLYQPEKMRDNFLNLGFKEVIMTIEGYLRYDLSMNYDPITKFTFIPDNLTNGLISNIS